MAQTKNKSEESVQVVVRCRPLNEKEIEQGWISADLLMKHIHSLALVWSATRIFVSTINTQIGTIY